MAWNVQAVAGSYERARGLRAVALHADREASTVDVGELLRWPGIPPMFAFRDQDGNSLTIVEAA